MSSLECLSRELNQIIGEVRHEKITVRTKALEKLEYIIDSRSDELTKLLSQTYFETQPSWDDLFTELVAAIQAQASRLESGRGANTASQQSKNRDYVNAIRKLIDLANKSKATIPYSSILDSAFECFEDEFTRKHFDLCFFQIVKKHVLSSKGNLAKVTLDNWKRLLTISFTLYRSANIQKLNLFEFITLIVQHGTKYTHLESELHQFLPKLIKIVEEDHKFKTQKELLRTIFEFTKNLAVNQRISICSFTETIFDTIVKYYEFNMEPDAKLTLFKLLHITLVVHYPQIPDGNGPYVLDTKATSDILKSNYADDPALWYKHLRNIFHIIEREIIQLNQSNLLQSNPSICNVFVQMAARACAVIFWDDNVWRETNVEQQHKRRRCSNKIHRFMDLIEGSKFCWRWMAILAQLLQDNPLLLTAEDFQPLLKLLIDFQPNVQYAVQIRIFTNIAKVLLARENDLKGHITMQEAFLTEHWNKMIDLSFHNSATNNTISSENLILLKILIDFKKTLSNDFLETILNAILSNSIKKSNISIDLMISIFRGVNTDLLKNAQTIKIGIINWLSSRVNAIDLKKLLENDGKLDLNLVGELYALCVLSKAEKLDNHRTVTSPNYNDADEFSTYIKELELNLQYQSVRKLLAIECNNKNKIENQSSAEEKLPDNNSTQTVINETYLQELEKMLSLDDEFKITENCFEDFMIVANSLATYLNVLNHFLKYKSMDDDYYSKSFLKKRILIKVEHLNMIAERFLSMKQESKDVFDILEKLLLIFDKNLLPILRNYVLNQPFNLMLIKWLTKQLTNRSKSNSKYIRVLKNENELEFYDKIQLKCLVLLAYFSNFDGDNGTAAFNAIADHEYNYECVEDLYMVFEILKIILDQETVTKDQAEWALDSMKLVCKKLTYYQQFIHLVAESIPKLVRIMKPFPATADDLMEIITVFLKQSKKRLYGPKLVIEIINGIKYVGKEYCDSLNDEVIIAILCFLVHFLHFNSLKIQLATVECLTYLFDKDWLNSYRLENVCCVKDFHINLFEELKIDEIRLSDADDMDMQNRNAGVRIQLYSSIIIKSYILRNRTWFGLMEFCCLKNMKDDTVSSIAKRICNELHSCDHKELLRDVIPFLMQMWLINNHHMTKFPWYLATSQTPNDFFVDNSELITDSVLKYRPSILPDLKEMMSSQTIRELITEPIIINCLSYLIPLNIHSRNLSENYKINANEMFKMLIQETPQCDRYFKTHPIPILEQLLFNTWDDELLFDYFEYNVDYFKEEHTINYEDFKKSLEYLQKKSSLQNIIHDSCKTNPYSLVTLLNSLKQHLQEAKFVEQKFACLFRICILIDYISATVAQQTTENSQAYHINGFFIRDLIYFFCNAINNNEFTLTLQLATCKYFLRFCKTILPQCALNFKPFLNNIVSVLVPLIKQSDNRKLINASLDLLDFLINQQQKHLKDAIALLDNFPNNSIFDELRHVHTQIKYNGREFSLVEEIEYFLKVDKRKIEGLLSLRDHLSAKKDQLSDVYKFVYKSQGFSEDCDQSLIHRLIFDLLKMIQGSDLEKSVVAAKCLGELGASDLGTIVLKSDAQQPTYKLCGSFEEAVESLCLVALEKLNALFLHMDSRVLNAVSAACHHLLQSELGNRLGVQFRFLGVFSTKANASVKIASKLPLRKTKNALELKPLFVSTENETYSTWIKKVTIAFLELFDDKYLQAVVALQALFAQAMLPLLVRITLSLNSTACNGELAEVVKIFFENHSNYIDEHGPNGNGNSQPIYLNKAAITSILQVAECIRIHNFNSPPKMQIPLPCIQIAKAANYCEAYFTAILYSELASSIQQEQTAKEANLLRSIMKKAYISIGKMDAVSAFLDPIKSRLQYHQLNQNWNQIYIHQDAISFSKPHNMEMYSNYLNQSGLYCLANAVTKNRENAVDYNCAWRLGDWDVIYKDDDSNSEVAQKTFNFDKYHYFALKCLRDKDKIGVKSFVKEAREDLIMHLKQSSFECTKNVYKNLADLQLLQQIEDFSEIQFVNDSTYSPEFMLNKWKYQDSIPVSDFQYREPVLAQRIALLNSAGIRAKRKIENYCQLTDGVQEMLLKLAKDCRKEGFYNFAARYLASLYSINPSREMKAHAYIEDAELNWCIGEKSLAKKLVHDVTEEQFVSLSIFTAKRLYGEYLAETRTENIKDIIVKYFQHSLDLLSKYKGNRHKVKNTAFEKSLKNFDEFEIKSKFKTYRSIAIYSDREFQQIASYKKSAIYEKKMSNIKRNEARLEEMNSRERLTKCEQQSRFILQNSIRIDRDDIESTLREYSEYLQLAIKNYLKALLLESNENTLNSSILFRIISLWLSNRSDPNATHLLERNYNRIPTYKFIPMLPQITAHLSTADDPFYVLIKQIVLNCAKEHPHHTLYQVLSLSNAYEDHEAAAAGSRDMNTDRVQSAQAIIEQVKGSRDLRSIVQQMEEMCRVLIKLANISDPEDNQLVPLMKLKNLNALQCPTVGLPVSINAQYPDTVGIVKWNNKIGKVGGINAPKKLMCHCTDGKQYPQLLKGKDDLREDAVMEQVFNILNDLLNHSKTTKKERMHIRTYIVVPLSQRSGILEWCVNTIPLTEYLVGSTKKPGAHQRYRPNDMTPFEAREKLQVMEKVPARKTSFNELQRVFADICDHLKPVFHNFFYEKFYSPGVWFERRLAYAHSLATTSMIGYILGIGDRHVSNILIDESTAELIHIDFGIAFEQGKCLPTPETIPFRLTRDLVAALGSTVVEGVFRKSCEKTMEVLRQNKKTILTILEVLLHDPLYSWTITNRAIQRSQNVEDVELVEDEDLNGMAERALIRLEEKLDGKPVSRSEITTVEGHVEILINEAVNPDNLCRLFVGWQAYL